MKLNDALSILIENILRAPDRLDMHGGEISEHKKRIQVLEFEKNQMLDRIILLEKQIKRKKNR